MIYPKIKSDTKSRLGLGVKLGQIEVKTRSNNGFIAKRRFYFRKSRFAWIYGYWSGYTGEMTHFTKYEFEKKWWYGLGYCSLQSAGNLKVKLSLVTSFCCCPSLWITVEVIIHACPVNKFDYQSPSGL